MYPALIPSISSELEMVQPRTQSQEMVYPVNTWKERDDSWKRGEPIGPLVDDSTDSFFVHSSTSDSQELSEITSDDNLISESVSSVDVELQARRGPFRSLSERAQTAQTRQLVACLRCRMQRIRVRFGPEQLIYGLTVKIVCNRPFQS